MIVNRLGVRAGFVGLALAGVAGACATGGQTTTGLSYKNDAGQLNLTDGGSSSGSTDDGSNTGDDSGTTSGSGTNSGSTTSSGGTTSGSGTTSSGSGTTSSSGTSSGTSSSTSSTSSGTTSSSSTSSSGTSSSSSSTSSGTTSSSSSSSGGPTTTGLSVVYQVGNKGTTAYPSCVIGVVNATAPPSAVPLAGLTVRYYFEGMGYPTPSITEQYSHIAQTVGPDLPVLTVTSTFGTVSSVNADSYVEFSFSRSDSTTLGPGQIAVFSWQMNASNPSNESYNQTNDYSYNASDTAAIPPGTPNMKIVLLQSGNVAWGTPP